MRNPREKIGSFELKIMGIYAVMICVFMLSSYFSEYRIWGLNLWAFIPIWQRAAIFVISLSIPFFVKALLTKIENDSKFHSDMRTARRLDIFYIGGIVLVFSILFGAFKAKTFFLGDGYQAISLLDSENVILKFSELGEMLFHIWVKKLVTGLTDNTALLSFQIISISSGILTLVTVGFLSLKLFDSLIKRVIFTLGIATCGSSLLFFGYAEYYSLFICSVTIYGISGLLNLRGILNLWWVILLNLVAIFFHIFGVVLIPVTIYLTLENFKMLKVKKLLSPITKKIFGFIGITIILSTFIYYYNSSYFFRFSIVPFLNNRFTVENYTMFSVKHIVDYLNLLLLLSPSIPIVFFVFLRRMDFIKNISKEEIYLGLFILVTCGAAFLFDPKLGMPRDWDLFAFATLPYTK